MMRPVEPGFGDLPSGSDVERIRHPEITPLELSDVRLNGGTLWEWSQGPGFATALGRALVLLRAGRANLPSHEPVPASVSGFEAVFVTGGRSADRKLRASLYALPFEVAFEEQPVFGGARGGFELLQTRGLSGWVVDLGKSQLKLAAHGKQWTFPRDWTRLRLASEVSRAEVPAQRRRLREFIALRLQMAMSESAQRPRALVFALPVKMDADGTLHRSNYAGMKGDRTLLPDVLQLAGLAGLPVFVLNDAELAAHSARLDARLSEFRKVLVLTLGFGIGAALIHRAGPSCPSSPQKA